MSRRTLHGPDGGPGSIDDSKMKSESSDSAYGPARRLLAETYGSGEMNMDDLFSMGERRLKARVQAKQAKQPKKKATGFMSFEERQKLEARRDMSQAELDISTPQPLVTIIVSSLKNEAYNVGEPSLSKITTSKNTFVIHKKLINHYSPFFATAFSSQFQEGLTQTMTIDDIPHQHFSIFANWIYHQQIKAPRSDRNEHADFLLLGELWALGQRFMAPAFQNDVMDAILAGPVLDRNIAPFVRMVYGFEDGREVLREAAIYRVGSLRRGEQQVVVAEGMLAAWSDLAHELAHRLEEMRTIGIESERDAEDFYVEEDLPSFY